MATLPPKTPTYIQRAFDAQDATFDALAKQAEQLGFDEAVLVLANSRNGLKVVRFHAVSESRAAVVIGEAEHMMIEKISAGAPPLTRPAKVARPKWRLLPGLPVD